MKKDKEIESLNAEVAKLREALIDAKVYGVEDGHLSHCPTQHDEAIATCSMSCTNFKALSEGGE